MKKGLLCILSFFIFQNCISQEKKIKPYFEGSFRVTYAANENFTSDEEESLLIPSGAFFRFGLGYLFGDKFSAGINAGYDHHFPFAINAFPTYVKVRYNIWGDLDGAVFVQSAIGKMWRPSLRYSDGNYYNAGIGLEAESGNRWKMIVQLTYHNKKIPGFENSGNLESISIGVGFRFF